MLHDHYLALRIQNVGDEFPYRVVHDFPDEYARLLLGPLSQINLFVGQNNAGKSRFLRFIYANPNFPGASSRVPQSVLFESLRQITNADPTGLKVLWSDLGIEHVWTAIYDRREQILASDLPTSEDTPIWERVSWLTYANACWRMESGAHSAMSNYREVVERFETTQDSPSHRGYPARRRVYIPILRGMRPLDPSSTDLFREKTKNDYLKSFSESSGGWQIVTGLSLYQDLKIMLLGTPEQRALVRRLEEFIARWFFDGKTVGLVPREPQRGEAAANTIEIIVGDGTQRAIHDWGDGLQTLLICLFDAFTHSDPGLYFIEEPDANLHPSYQRALLDALRYLSHHQFFLTTHSNHFLDIASDSESVAVFRFSRVAGQVKDQFDIRATTQLDRTVLQDLGARPSSTLLANATIWVEGVTDRHYIKAYMARYVDELRNGTDSDQRLARTYSSFREDRHYSFVEYQGSNLEHWTFGDASESDAIRATFVCARAFVVADGDIATKGDRAARFSKMLGDRFHLIPGKEIENLIPIALLKAFARAQVGDEFTWTGEELELPPHDQGIGAYLDRMTGQPGAFTKGGKSGADTTLVRDTATIRQKGPLCDFVVAQISDPSNGLTLPRETRKLCEKVFRHIAKENGIDMSDSATIPTPFEA